MSENKEHTMEATWAGEAYIITFTPVKKGQKGWAEYQASLATIADINRALGKSANYKRIS